MDDKEFNRKWGGRPRLYKALSRASSLTMVLGLERLSEKLGASAYMAAMPKRLFPLSRVFEGFLRRS